MRIYDNNVTGPSVNETAKSQETQRTTGTGTTRNAGAGASEDRVEISSTLDTLSRALAADDAKRADRVNVLEVQFAAGSYQPDSKATSHALVSDMLASVGA